MDRINKIYISLKAMDRINRIDRIHGVVNRQDSQDYSG